MTLQFNHPFQDRGFHNFDENLNQPRHRWYPFKEGFSNQLVQEAIAQTQDNQKRPLRILDPFGGSGTTPLTATLLGHEAVSVEVNPFCVFASRVKCTHGQWREREYRQAVDQVIREGEKYNDKSHLESLSTFSEGNRNTKWLFNRDVIRAFTWTIRAINKYTSHYSSALRLAAIRAAMLCCNAKKDGKCLRYYPDWEKRRYSREHFYQAFRAMTELIFQDIQLAPISQKRVKIIKGDARIALAGLPDDSFDLLVTSPPYLNSFDYSDVYRPELFLGGFVSDNQELRKVRLQTIRSHVQVKWTGSTVIENQLVKGTVKMLKEAHNIWDKRLPTMVEAYFHDMQKIISQAFRLLRCGAEAWIVVSTSAYGGIQIPVDLILANIGSECGFDLRGVYVLRKLRTSSQQWMKFGSREPPLRESLIVFRR